MVQNIPAQSERKVLFADRPVGLAGRGKHRLLRGAHCRVSGRHVTVSQVALDRSIPVERFCRSDARNVSQKILFAKEITVCCDVRRSKKIGLVKMSMPTDFASAPSAEVLRTAGGCLYRSAGWHH